MCLQELECDGVRFWYGLCELQRKVFERERERVGKEAVWPDWAIYWTLGHFSKPAATISLQKSPTFLFSLYKGLKIFNFSSEIIFGQLFMNIWQLFTGGHTARENGREREIKDWRSWRVKIGRKKFVAENWISFFQTDAKTKKRNRGAAFASLFITS